MSLPNLFSRRKRLKEATVQDIYVYDVLPVKVRVQIIHLWCGAIGNYSDGYANSSPAEFIYSKIVDVLKRDFGVFQLSPKYVTNNQDDLAKWFLEEKDIDKCFDAIELSFREIDYYVRDNEYRFTGYVTISPEDAIKELNARFLEASIGYQYDDGELIKLDSLVVHREIIIPALTLLRDAVFSTANSEYREAHRLFKSGDYELCLTECCKAFESVLKIIANQRDWHVSQNDSASKLVAAVFENSLLPPHVLAGFSALRSLLESSIPSIRNRTSGHGAGATPRLVPKYLASFQLTQTAAAIIFLVSAHNESPLPTRSRGRPVLEK